MKRADARVQMESGAALIRRRVGGVGQEAAAWLLSHPAHVNRHPPVPVHVPPDTHGRQPIGCRGVERESRNGAMLCYVRAATVYGINYNRVILNGA